MIAGRDNAGRRLFGHLHICSKTQIRKVAKRTGATHLISLVDPGDRIIPPQRIGAECHLSLIMDDVEDCKHPYAPCARHLNELVSWLEGRDCECLLIHCVAGVSRSPAIAFGLLCVAMPVADAATELRRIRPQASPNALISWLWDRRLGMDGALHRAALELRGPDIAGMAVPVYPDAICRS